MARKRSGSLLVVSGLEQGSVFPEARDQVDLNILLDGRESAFEVRGGVYSGQVSAIGPGTVRGPLLAGDNARFEVGAPDMQRYLSGVSALHSLFFAADSQRGWGVSESPTFGIPGIRFVVRGDISAGEKVVVQNGLVIGGITAPSVELKGSIVLGQIMATTGPGELRATCSTLGLYDAKRVTLEGPTTIVAAGGASDEQPVLSDYVQGARSFPFAMRMLSLCRIDGIGCGVPNTVLTQVAPQPGDSEPFTSVPGMCCEYWARRACPFMEAVSLSHADFVALSVDQEAQDQVSIGPPSPLSTGRQRWFFGLQNRALALHKIKEVDDYFYRLLHYVFAYDHLGDRGRAWLADELASERVAAQETSILRMAIEGLESRH